MHRTSFKRVSDKTIRLDSAPDGAVDTGAAARAQKRSVLDLFRAWIRSAPAERRQAARHDASGGRLWLGWWDGGRVFTAISTEVMNISRGGALVRAVEAPQELREIWVCLDVTEPGDCVPATVLSVEPICAGAWTVRFEFSEPCPRGFLAATLSSQAPRAVGRI